jgi:hypothetical protein
MFNIPRVEVDMRYLAPSKWPSKCMIVDSKPRRSVLRPNLDDSCSASSVKARLHQYSTTHVKFQCIGWQGARRHCNSSPAGHLTPELNALGVANIGFELHLDLRSPLLDPFAQLVVESPIITRPGPLQHSNAPNC